MKLRTNPSEATGVCVNIFYLSIFTVIAMRIHSRTLSLLFAFFINFFSTSAIFVWKFENFPAICSICLLWCSGFILWKCTFISDLRHDYVSLTMAEKLSHRPRYVALAIYNPFKFFFKKCGEETNASAAPSKSNKLCTSCTLVSARWNVSYLMFDNYKCI